MEVLHGELGELQSVCNRTMQALFASPSTHMARRMCCQRGRPDAALLNDSFPHASDLDNGGLLPDASGFDARGPKATPNAAAASPPDATRFHASRLAA